MQPVISLTISKLSVTGYCEIVHELKQNGLILDQDFSWSFNRADNNFPFKNSCTFSFAEEYNATYFMLKWSHLILNNEK